MWIAFQARCFWIFCLYVIIGILNRIFHTGPMPFIIQLIVFAWAIIFVKWAAVLFNFFDLLCSLIIVWLKYLDIIASKTVKVWCSNLSPLRSSSLSLKWLRKSSRYIKWRTLFFDWSWLLVCCCLTRLWNEVRLAQSTPWWILSPYLQIVIHRILHCYDWLSFLFYLICVTHSVQHSHCSLFLSVTTGLATDISITIDLLSDSHALSRKWVLLLWAQDAWTKWADLLSVRSWLMIQ